MLVGANRLHTQGEFVEIFVIHNALHIVQIELQGAINIKLIRRLLVVLKLVNDITEEADTVMVDRRRRIHQSISIKDVHDILQNQSHVGEDGEWRVHQLVHVLTIGLEVAQRREQIISLLEFRHSRRSNSLPHTLQPAHSSDIKTGENLQRGVQIVDLQCALEGKTSENRSYLSQKREYIHKGR